MPTNPNPFLRSSFDAVASEPVAPVDIPDLNLDVPAAAAGVPDALAPATATPAVKRTRKAKTDNLAPPDALRGVFEGSAKEFDVPVNVLMALAHQESRYDGAAVNAESGASGIAQYMAATAKALGINPNDPNEAIPAMAMQIRERLDKGYSMADAVKEHFAGPNRALWKDKTAVYGDEVLAKAGAIGKLLYPETAAREPEKQNQFSARMPRSEYYANFMALNPNAAPDAIQNAMAQYDVDAAAMTAAGGNKVQDKFAQMASPEATFNAKLDAKLQARNKGVVQVQPGNAQPANPASQSIAADKPGIGTQAAGDFGRGIDNLKALGYGVGGLAADAAGYDDEADRMLTEYVAIQNETGKKNPATIGSYTNVKSLGDAARYAVEAVFENLPMMLPSLVTGGVGAVVARKAAEKMVGGMIASQIAKNVTREVAEKNAAQFVAKTILAGSVAGAAPVSVGMEAGSIMGDIYQETGKKEAGTALAYGLPAGLLDSIGPVMALRKIAGPIVDEVAGGIIKRLGVEAGKQFLIESGTEGLQTIIERAGVTQASGKKLFTPELLEQVIDATLKGGIGGAVIGTASQGVAEVRGAMAPAPVAQPAPAAEAAPVPAEQVPAPAPAAPAPAAGPLSAAVTSAAPAAPQAPADTFTIAGDDGSVNVFDGESIVPVEPASPAIPAAPSGPLGGALNGAAEAHQVTPIAAPELPAAPVTPPAPPAIETLPMEELRARLKATTSAIKVGRTAELVAERNAVQKEINTRAKEAAQETAKLAEVPASTGPFATIEEANKMAPRVAEQTAQVHQVVKQGDKFILQPFKEQGNGEASAVLPETEPDGNRSGADAVRPGPADRTGLEGSGPVPVVDRADAGGPVAKVQPDPVRADAAADAKPALKEWEKNPYNARQFASADLAAAFMEKNKVDAGAFEAVPHGTAQWKIKPRAVAVPDSNVIAESNTIVQVDDELRAVAEKETAADTEHWRIKHDVETDQQGVIPGKSTSINQSIKAGRYTVEDIAKGWNNTRAMLRERHGDTVTLYRADAPQEKWHADTQVVYMGDKVLADKFTRDGERKVTKYEIPVDDVLALNVQKNGYYEFIVKRQGPAMEAAAQTRPSGPQAAPETPKADKLTAARAKHQRQDEAVAAAAENIAKRKADAEAKTEPKQNGIDAIMAMEEDAGEGFKSNPRGIAIIRAASQNMTPQAKAAVTRTINKYTKTEKDGTVLVKTGLYNEISEKFGYVEYMLSDAVDAANETKSVAKAEPALAQVNARAELIATLADKPTKELRDVAANHKRAYMRDAAANLLAERAEETSAKRSQAMKQRIKRDGKIDTDTDHMAQAIAKLGGINRDSVKGRMRLAPEELAVKANVGNLARNVFVKNGGMKVDQAGAAMAELGYVSLDDNGKHDQSEWEDMLAQVAGGEQVYTATGMVLRAEAMRAMEMDELQAKSEAEFAKIETLADDLEQWADDNDIDLPETEALYHDEHDQPLITEDEIHAYFDQGEAQDAGRQDQDDSEGQARAGAETGADAPAAGADFLQSQSAEDLKAKAARAADQGIADKELADSQVGAFSLSAPPGSVEGEANAMSNSRQDTFFDIPDPKDEHPFNGVTREQFLGKPRITPASNASDLRPNAGKSTEQVQPDPFMGGQYIARFGDSGIAVFDGDKVIASYDKWNTLVVDKKYRRQGIGEEMVYQWRMRNPGASTAKDRTKAAQKLQEKVWDRIARERDQVSDTFDIPSDRTIEVDGVRRPITNSKGQLVAQTFAGQVAFWKWFGSSAAVDAQGRPIVLFHGTDQDFTSFAKEKLGESTGAKSAEQGFFFVSRPDVAESYAHHAALDAAVRREMLAADKADEEGDFDEYDKAIARAEELESEIAKNLNRGQNVMLTYVSLRNPAIMDAKGELFGNIQDQINSFIGKAKRSGNDGVIIKNLDDDPRFSDRVGDHFIAFKQEQIKSATGNNGSFDPSSNNITHDVSIEQTRDLMSDGPLSRMEEPKRVMVLANLKRLQKLRGAGKMTDEAYRAQVEVLIGRIGERNEAREDAKLKDKERGADWVEERLMRAKRAGELDSATVDFALWALRKSPSLAADLAISVRSSGAHGSAGSYGSADRIMTLVKGKVNEGTAVHEMLHHTERMMPAAIQQGIAKAWLRAYSDAWTKADAPTRTLLDDLMAGGAGDKAAFERTVKAFGAGKLDYDAHYQLVNASEFWAVNATRIMAGRYDGAVNGWAKKAKQWLTEMVQYLKGALRMNSDAPILKGLAEVLNGDGNRVSSKMLGQLPVANQIVFHGTPHKFDKFTLDNMGGGEGAQAYGFGLYFAGEKKVAEYYRDGLTPAGSKGSMYKVDIPEDDEYLNLDKSLKEQPAAVKAALKKIADTLPGAKTFTGPSIELYRAINAPSDWHTGHWAYNFLAEQLGRGNWKDDKAASLLLKEYGIPGAMYADALTRGTAEQTFNYVIYDAADVEMMANDIAVNSGTYEADIKGGKVFIDVERGDYGYWLTANIDGEPVGTMMIGEDRAEPDKYSVTQVAVDKEHQRKGIASALYDTAHAAGIQPIVRDKRQSTEARAMWVKQKYEWKPKQKPKFKGDAFITHDITAGAPPAAAADTGLTPPDQGMLRRLQSTVQDNLNRLKQVQERIAKLTGVPVAPVADYYGAETNRPGRVATRLEDAQDKLTGPLMEQLAKSGYTPEQLNELLHAMHASERNEAVAKINPDFPDNGSGMTDDAANAILDRYQSATELHAMAAKARNIAAATLDMKLAYGLISDDQHELLSEMYENYVPLKGDGEYGPKIKRAMGHGERDEFIMENIARDYAQAVVAGEKNLARQSLLQMVLRHPDADLWTARVPPKGRYVAGTVLTVKRDGTAVAAFTSQSQVSAFLEAKGPQASQYTVETSAGEQVVEFTKPLQDNEVMVYVKGQAVRLQIHDEKLALQLRPLDVGQMNVVLEFMRGVNRHLSKVYTGYNPAFIVRNTARDALTGTINMLGNEGITITAKAWSNYPRALADMTRWAATKQYKDRVHSNGMVTNYLKEYRDHGGKVGASWMSDLEQQGKSLTEMYDNARGLFATVKDTGASRRSAVVAWNKTVGKLARFVEILNQGTENALRLSLFIALREAGHTPARAAQAAKGVTVDFDRKGTATPSIGAVFLFFNPAVQGTTNAGKTLFKGKHKGQAWTALGMLASLGYFLAAAGMDDDKDRWLGTEWEIRSRNFMLKTGDHQVKIPVSQEFAPFFAFGAAVAEASRGESKIGAAGRMVSSFIDAYFPLNIQRDDSDNIGMDLIGGAMPTIVKPYFEIATNRSSFGGVVVPESEFTRDRPDNLKMNRATKNSTYDKAAQGIAAIGTAAGAREYENDISKVSPETLKLLWRTYTGGLGTFIADAGGLAAMAFDDADQINRGDVPIVKDFVRPVDVKPIQGRFYDLQRDTKKVITEFKQAVKAGDGEAIQNITDDPAAAKVVGLTSLITQLNKAAAELSDRAVDVNADKTLTGLQKREKLKEIDVEKENLYRIGIDAFKN